MAAKPLYDSIGATYGATRRADPAIARALAEFVGADRDAPFLDVACGTGNYTSALAALGGRWCGVDLSDRMLRQAASKSRSIAWQRGSAEALPYGDARFAGAICTLAIHHFPGLPGPFREVFRVLADGRFVLFTSFREQMQSYWLRHYFPEMLERAALQMPARATVVDALGEARFDVEAIVLFQVTNELEDLFLYSGKDRPHCYLDAAFRANISSFATLCSATELQAGLAALRADLEADTFRAVAARYSSQLGDYAFVVARKRPR